MVHTLSFAILDDLEHITSKCIKLESLTKEEITRGVEKCIEEYGNVKNNIFNYSDISGYFDKEFFSKQKYLETIVQELYDENYFVCNQYEKYYVIAFSIDYTKFKVFSKDCDKELISWDKLQFLNNLNAI